MAEPKKRRSRTALACVKCSRSKAKCEHENGDTESACRRCFRLGFVCEFVEDPSRAKRTQKKAPRKKIHAPSSESPTPKTEDPAGTLVLHSGLSAGRSGAAASAEFETRLSHALAPPVLATDNLLDFDAGILHTVSNALKKNSSGRKRATHPESKVDGNDNGGNELEKVQRQNRAGKAAPLPLLREWALVACRRGDCGLLGRALMLAGSAGHDLADVLDSAQGATSALAEGANSSSSSAHNSTPPPNVQIVLSPGALTLLPSSLSWIAADGADASSSACQHPGDRVGRQEKRPRRLVKSQQRHFEDSDEEYTHDEDDPNSDEDEEGGRGSSRAAAKQKRKKRSAAAALHDTQVDASALSPDRLVLVKVVSDGSVEFVVNRHFERLVMPRSELSLEWASKMDERKKKQAEGQLKKSNGSSGAGAAGRDNGPDTVTLFFHPDDGAFVSDLVGSLWKDLAPSTPSQGEQEEASELSSSVDVPPGAVRLLMKRATPESPSEPSQQAGSSKENGRRCFVRCGGKLQLVVRRAGGRQTSFLAFSFLPVAAEVARLQDPEPAPSAPTRPSSSSSSFSLMAGAAADAGARREQEPPLPPHGPLSARGGGGGGGGSQFKLNVLSEAAAAAAAAEASSTLSSFMSDSLSSSSFDFSSTASFDPLRSISGTMDTSHLLRTNHPRSNFASAPAAVPGAAPPPPHTSSTCMPLWPSSESFYGMGGAGSAGTTPFGSFDMLAGAAAAGAFPRFGHSSVQQQQQQQQQPGSHGHLHPSSVPSRSPPHHGGQQPRSTPSPLSTLDLSAVPRFNPRLAAAALAASSYPSQLDPSNSHESLASAAAIPPSLSSSSSFNHVYGGSCTPPQRPGGSFDGSHAPLTRYNHHPSSGAAAAHASSISHQSHQQVEHPASFESSNSMDSISARFKHLSSQGAPQFGSFDSSSYAPPPFMTSSCSGHPGGPQAAGFPNEQTFSYPTNGEPPGLPISHSSSSLSPWM